MSDSSKVLFLTLFCGLAGCKFGDTPEGMFPIGNEGQVIGGSSDDLRSFVIGGGTSTWIREAAPRQSGVHGRVQAAFNNLYLEARRTNNLPMPLGASCVKEILNDDNTHAGWTMSLKTKEGDGADTWTWWEAFAPDHQHAAFGIGIFSCERCHGAFSKDRSLISTIP